MENLNDDSVPASRNIERRLTDALEEYMKDHGSHLKEEEFFSAVMVGLGSFTAMALAAALTCRKDRGDGPLKASELNTLEMWWKMVKGWIEKNVKP